MSMKVNRIVQGWDESGAPNERAGSRVAEVREGRRFSFSDQPRAWTGKNPSLKWKGKYGELHSYCQLPHQLWCRRNAPALGHSTTCPG